MRVLLWYSFNKLIIIWLNNIFFPRLSLILMEPLTTVPSNFKDVYPMNLGMDTPGNGFLTQPNLTWWGMCFTWPNMDFSSGQVFFPHTGTWWIEYEYYINPTRMVRFVLSCPVLFSFLLFVFSFFFSHLTSVCLKMCYVIQLGISDGTKLTFFHPPNHMLLLLLLLLLLLFILFINLFIYCWIFL